MGSLLGALPEPSLSNHRTELGTGDSLLLYTDGVTEARRYDDFFGEGRLATTFGTVPAPASVLVARVLDDVLDFQAGNPRDDIAIVAVTVP